MNIWNVIEDFGTPRNIVVNRTDNIVKLKYISFDYCDLFIVCDLNTLEFVKSYREWFSILNNSMVTKKLSYEDIEDYLE